MYLRPMSQTKNDDQRIAKLLARAGVASRREIERMIADGRIALNGKVLDTPATILKSLDGVTVDGLAVAEPEPARLFLYHKPPGLLVTEHDPAGRPTIYDRLPEDLPRLVPVGRLDLNTEGLLLLTTDGELKRQLELPATGVERSYRARAYGPITQEQLEELIHGIEIEGIRYGKIDANLERRTGANTWIEMTLTEGKNREVRRVLEHLGLQVSRLIRTRYGPFLLGDLTPGQIGEVKGHDVAAFRKDPTRNPPPEKQQDRKGEEPSERPRRDSAPRRDSTPTRPPRPAPRPSPVEIRRDAAPRRMEPRADPRSETSPTPWAKEERARAAPNRAAVSGRGPAPIAPKRWYKAPESTGAPTARPARDDRPARTGERPARSFGDRPERGVAPGTRPQREARPARDDRGPPRPPRDGKPTSVAKPARAARAEAHRSTREDRPGDIADRPRGKPIRTAGPAGGRGKPSKPGKPTRPTKTRK